jgi:AcrR family transcriptional regulator
MSASLVERRKAQTREEIARVALGLFHRDGYAHVSVERIANESGVSLRTFYRYFEAKEDVLSPILEGGTEELAAAVMQRPREEDLATAVRLAYVEIAPGVDGYARVRLLITLLLTVPALRDRWLAHLRTLEDRLVPALGARATSKLSEVEARLTAAAIVAGLRISLELWARRGSEEPPPVGFARALDYLRAGAQL